MVRLCGQYLLKWKDLSNNDEFHGVSLASICAFTLCMSKSLSSLIFNLCFASFLLQGYSYRTVRDEILSPAKAAAASGQSAAVHRLVSLLLQWQACHAHAAPAKDPDQKKWRRAVGDQRGSILVSVLCLNN